MTIGQLMKNLRAKGWIPRGYNEVIHTVYDKKHKIIGLYKEGKEYLELVYKKSLRELCAKESGLWQFVCENGMVNEGDVKNFVWQRYELNGFEPQYPLIHKWNVAEYRLIESALCDEDKLEEFLLDNIKIDG